MIPNARHRTEPALRPRIRGRDESKARSLPEWRPEPPSTGWTPASALRLAADYAAGAGASDPNLDVDRVTRAAYMELLRTVPGLHAADIMARLILAREAPALTTPQAPIAGEGPSSSGSSVRLASKAM